MREGGRLIANCSFWSGDCSIETTMYSWLMDADTTAFEVTHWMKRGPLRALMGHRWADVHDLLSTGSSSSNVETLDLIMQDDHHCHRCTLLSAHEHSPRSNAVVSSNDCDASDKRHVDGILALSHLALVPVVLHLSDQPSLPFLGLRRVVRIAVAVRHEVASTQPSRPPVVCLTLFPIHNSVCLLVLELGHSF